MYIESINEGNIHYFHHLAGLYSDSRKMPDEALRWARRDAEIRKGVYALDCLAWALYGKGEFKEAAETIEKRAQIRHAGLPSFFSTPQWFFSAPATWPKAATWPGKPQK